MVRESIPDDVVPKAVIDATCEYAKELLKADRGDDSAVEGVKSVGLGQGAVAIEFNADDRKQLFTKTVKEMLRPYGRIKTERRSSIPMRRV